VLVAAGADADMGATASAAFAAGTKAGSMNMARIASNNAPPIILVLSIGKMCFVRGRECVLRAIYQRQPVELDHGEIQREEHGAKDDERSNERKKIVFHSNCSISLSFPLARE
jgi:hypothetical protein